MLWGFGLPPPYFSQMDRVYILDCKSTYSWFKTPVLFGQAFRIGLQPNYRRQNKNYMVENCYLIMVVSRIEIQRPYVPNHRIR